VWQLRSDDEVTSSNVEDHIAWVLSKIEPFQAAIKSYIDDPEIEVNMRITCRCPDLIGGTSISSYMMMSLSLISNRIDISCIGEVDELTTVEPREGEPG
jgi:hypothetical protein